jgi:nucleoside-diphosphate-sugar epimerase
MEGRWVASLDHRRTFCYIDDAVELIRRVAAAPACAGDRLNVGVAAPEVRIRELAGLVAATVGKRSRAFQAVVLVLGWTSAMTP